jgi:hypothetical protein
MGFRDLALFNQAMLAKQGWRLLTDPNSLCARVLKGRYYPQSDFWNATKLRSASYTWRSILHGRALLFQGIPWGIANGRSVKILKDNWIPDLSPEVLKPTLPIPASATVHCLLDESTGTWNDENIHAFFDADTAAKILQIQVARHTGEDFVCWPHTRHGIFSVRSAYNLARTRKFSASLSRTGRGMSSAWVADEKAWKMVWKIQAPGKMNIHLWRFAHDCLPSGHQLCKRQIPADGACIFCGRPESISHAMLLRVWFGGKLKRRFLSGFRGRVSSPTNNGFLTSCLVLLFSRRLP